LPSAGAGLKRPTNLFLMDLAAAPETCCAMMPLLKLRNGSTSSARPSGEKMRQWCFSMTGLSLGSVLIRWAQASSRRRSVVVVGRGTPVFEGEESMTLSEYVSSRDPPGVFRGALV